MRRVTSVVLTVLVAFGAFTAADALGPESVPVATAVELHGEAPESGPPPAGFFIVPPRVIDMRDDDIPARIEDDGEDSDADDADGDDGPSDANEADQSDDEPDDAAYDAHEGDEPDEADEPDHAADDDDDD